MTETFGPDTAVIADLGEYCRLIEQHLARVNAGHLVRVFGASFDLVRRWHDAAIPLSVVYRGIERKAERHRAGRSQRPLRLEFCAPDVESLFVDWRRAVGVPVESSEAAFAEDASPAVGKTQVPDHRKPSLARQLDRALQKMSQTLGQLGVAPDVAAEQSRIVDELVALRELSRRARGAGRAEVLDRLFQLDRAIANLARALAPEAADETYAEAAAELAPYRSRLSAGDWSRSVAVAADRLLRARLALPTLDLETTE